MILDIVAAVNNAILRYANKNNIGVRIIAGLICVTVLMEIWHLGWYLFSGTSNSDGILSSIFQLCVGLMLCGTIIYSLCRENAAFLLPYLLLQTVGLATGFVILFALIYVTIDDDVSTIKAFFDSHGTNVVFNDNMDTKQPIRYMGFMMVGSCIVVIALQFWLISIVFSCWRYFR
uniref:Uncharacterized protein n=1 Tax=Panagrolaimus sp. ES5 TaxID=591445 RepID=A0AC34FZQ8_9BILA